MIDIIEQRVGLIQCPACAALHINFLMQDSFLCNCCDMEFDLSDANTKYTVIKLGKYFF